MLSIHLSAKLDARAVFTRSSDLPKHTEQEDLAGLETSLNFDVGNSRVWNRNTVTQN
jgi:hypothetical protein